MTPDQLKAKRDGYEKQLELLQTNIQRLSGAIGAINELLNEQEAATTAPNEQPEGGESTDGETATEDIRDTEAGTTEDAGGTDEGAVAAA
jgi:hypothetical protein